ncbi:MAG: DUF364 domain-containing protein [Desulfurococcales archaeon]|nr:DUF364 domain-containing protein [Desulfurococcales archaeon]
MLLLDEICEYVVNEVSRRGLEFATVDLCVGLRYTYAVVRSGREEFIGFSYTPLEDLTHIHQEVSEYADVSLGSVCDLIRSVNPLAKAVALAYLNAVSATITEVPADSLGKDLLDCMKFSSNDVVVFVGYIGPLVRRVSGKVREVYVLERNPLRRQAALPDTAAPRVLPRATKVVITGASLVNDTIDQVLGMCRGNAEIALVGATASTYPEPLFNAGIRYVAGFRAHREHISDAVRCVKLAGGTRELYRYGSKYVLTGSRPG